MLRYLLISMLSFRGNTISFSNNDSKSLHWLALIGRNVGLFHLVLSELQLSCSVALCFAFKVRSFISMFLQIVKISLLLWKMRKCAR